MNFSNKILNFYFNLPKKDLPLPNGVETIYPFENKEVQSVMKTFFQKYYADSNL